jgi:inosine-uridine nucleoside N-ribohydrolase
LSIWDLKYDAQVRVILDTDAKNEADDQFAIVHALLSPSLDVRGLVPAHFGNRRGPESMQESREEIDLLLGLLDMKGEVRVADGAAFAIPDIKTPVDSAGARLIIEEAMNDDAAPLFVAFLGPLTDMASALLIEPRIADRDLTVIWIGGPPYGDLGIAYRPEFNLSNDIVAANIIFASSLKLWQVPMSTYVMMAVSYAELYEQVNPCGEIGRYLVRQLVEFNEKYPHTGRSSHWPHAQPRCGPVGGTARPRF